jgi:DNA-binding LacI/PurR family transcriptional regulator
MKSKKYTISDVAKALGVSRSTISKAMSNSPGVGKELRQRILDYVNEIGYTPNSIAQGLIKGKLNIVALILGDVRNPFYAELEFCIQKILNKNGYNVMMFNSEYEVEKELEYISMAKQFNFAGLILLTAQSQEIMESFQDAGMAVVLVNRIIPGYKGDSVLIDNFKAGYIATMHLIEKGHNHIGFVKGHNLSSASSLRFEGYLQALKNYNLQYDEASILVSDLKMNTGYEIGKQFMNLPHRPTGMIIVNDLTALSFMQYCKENQLRIPEDVSVVSFDNIVYTSLAGINLSTVSQHVREMGEHAARLMLKQLNNPEAASERVILEPTLIVRGTTQAIAPS